MTAPRRLTIVVEFRGSTATSLHHLDAAAVALDPKAPCELVTAQWGEPEPPGSKRAFDGARPGWDHCAHCHAEGRPCWVHAQ